MLETSMSMRVRRPKLIMLVGLPGCGKSSWVKNLPRVNEFLLSTDAYIEWRAKKENISYGESLEKYYSYAERSMNQSLSVAIEGSFNIIWDQTNLTKDSRARKLALIPDHYTKECIVFSIPENHREILAERIEKPIPKKVIKGMKHRFEYPTHDEGFSKITHLDYFKEKT